MRTSEIHYALGLVIVSVLISVVSSYAALSFAERVRAASTVGLRRCWLAGGSIAMGAGVWTMHFLGMLALHLPVAVFYFWPAVLLSMVPAIAASAVALNVVSRETLSSSRLLVGGLLVAAGIASMHYIGMAAMRSTAMEHYNPWAVLLSVVAAAGFSWLALWIAFASRSSGKHATSMRVAGSMVMGLGIAAMHYIAMAGVHFDLSSMPFSMAHTVQIDRPGECGIAIVTGFILLAALGTSTMDKWKFRDLQNSHAELIQAQDALLRSQKELREANAVLNDLSVRDGLTGLYNRRHFDGALDTEFRRAFRHRQPISLLMIDVDCFKALNDSYGHQRGDDCLREVAGVLAAYPRRGYDVAARYGGEEFAVLLPGADVQAARIVAEEIRLAVQALGIENQGSRVTDVATVSIGVGCERPEISSEPDELVRAADVALYAAKRLGRNRVEITAGDLVFVA